MANTIGTSTLSGVWRIKYAQATLNLALRSALVAEKICQVDRSDSYYITNPYLTGATAAVAAVAGNYAVSTATTTDDTCTVTDQVTYGVHLFEFEQSLARADLYTSFVQDMTNAIGVKVDQFVLNKVLAGATGTYTTAVGGFQTPSNINGIIGDLTGIVSGYSQSYKGLFLVIENTELSGFIQAGMTNGFAFADSVLNNGFGGRYAGVEIYVVRAGTFTSSAIGTLSPTNLGHRLFGVKEMATYAAPRGAQYVEKDVTLLTGKEIAMWANIGAKVWTPTAALLVNITLA